MSLIDADAMDNAFSSLRFYNGGNLTHWGDRKDWCLHGDEIEKLISNAPTVDVAPIVHVKWIFGETLGHSWMKCSCCCKSQSGQTLTFSYCPNCGALMDGKTE